MAQSKFIMPHLLKCIFKNLIKKINFFQEKVHQILISNIDQHCYYQCYVADYCRI
jgi:hypothetical protein